MFFHALHLPGPEEVVWTWGRRRMKNHEKVALTALYTSVDAILFFAIYDVIPHEM